MGTEAAAFAGASELVVEGIEKGAKPSVKPQQPQVLNSWRGIASAGKLGGGPVAFEDYIQGLVALGISVTEHRMDDAHTVRALAHYYDSCRQSRSAGDFGAHVLENARIELAPLGLCRR